MLKSRLELNDMIYVGLGSIWFADFVWAHKSLDIRHMVSIENDDIGYRRARFNKPYATVQVRHGHSSEVLARLHNDDYCKAHPWVVWLDYDGGLNEVATNDIRSIIEKSPADTILLTTFNGRDGDLRATRRTEKTTAASPAREMSFQIISLRRNAKATGCRRP